MKKFNLFFLILITSCIDIHPPSSAENNQSLPRKKSNKAKNQSSNQHLKKHLNLTKRKNLDIAEILEKYSDIKTITIKSGKRGSVSFSVNELAGGTHVNVISSPSYEILIKDDNNHLFTENME